MVRTQYNMSMYSCKRANHLHGKAFAKGVIRDNMLHLFRITRKHSMGSTMRCTIKSAVNMHRGGIRLVLVVVKVRNVQKRAGILNSSEILLVKKLLRLQ